MSLRALGLLCALLIGGVAGEAHAAEDWLSLPGARHGLVDEPVFGGQAWVYEVGREHPQAVVLVHGVGDEAADIWSRLVPQLAQRYHVLTFDLPGFGRSTKANALYSPANYAAFIHFVVKSRLRGPFKLVGHSMGGAVSLRYAGLHPEDVSQLVLVDVAGILDRSVYTEFASYAGVRNLPELYDRQDAHLADLAGRVIRKLQLWNVGTHGEMLETPARRELFLGGQPRQIAAIALLAEDFSEAIARVRAPTLVIWGEQDPVAPVRTGKLLASNIPGGRLRVLPGLKHAPMLDDPEGFNAVVREELAHTPAELARLAATEGYARPPELPKTERVGRCVDSSDMEFRGDYAAIVIERCRRVKLINVQTTKLIAINADVEIENSHITAEDVAIRAEHTEIRMTGGSIRGFIGMELLGARIDLAGVHVLADAASARALGRGGSEVIFSVSYVSSDEGEGFRHGPRALRPNEAL